MWKIGEVEIANQVVVGPMAGISNSAFREIAQRFGAGLIYTEMISDKAICYKNVKTLKMAQIKPEEGLVSIQLFGHEVDSMVQAAKYLNQETTCAIIDINMGCPVPKVVNTGAGCALMRTPDLAYEIVKAVSEAVEKPVTVKMRIGWDKNQINAIEFAQTMEKAGAKALAVHGRTRSQYYEETANWEIIKAVKEAVGIPVIGNGDIKSPADAKKRIEESGCEAIMLARGILGNPWLIKEAINAMGEGNNPEVISVATKFEMAKEHAIKLIELKGEKAAMLDMRGHACWYITGLPYNHTIKQQLNVMTSYQQFDTILKSYQENLSEFGV